MLENQLNLLDKLFEEWKKTDSQEFRSDSHFAFSKDGIICSDEYGKNNPKLLFIAKEPNAGGVYNSDIFWIKNFLTDKSQKKSLFSNRIVMMSNCYYNTDLGYDVLRKISYMNLKKTAGSSQCNYNDLNNYCANEERRKFIKREIEILSPDLIVCCGNDVKNILFNIFHDNINYKLICVKHPSYFFISNLAYKNDFESKIVRKRRK